MESEPDNYVLVSVWKDLAAVKGFAGAQWQRPVALPGEAHLMEESIVHHYENLVNSGDTILIDDALLPWAPGFPRYNVRRCCLSTATVNGLSPRGRPGLRRARGAPS